MMGGADRLPARGIAKTPRARRAATHIKENPSAIVTPLCGWNDGDRLGPAVSRSAPSCSIPESNTTADGLTHGTLADQFNADGVQSFHQLQQGIDMAPEDAL